MTDGAVGVRTLIEGDREPLRLACAADPDVWAIYPYSMVGDAFDTAFANRLNPKPNSIGFALLLNGSPVGLSSYLDIDPANATLEIGGTYIAPSVRGGSYNRAVKLLMLGRAFACGAQRVQFCVDTRNGRSMAAVEKLGAHHEGVLRSNRLTWTGHRRDTAVYSILASEWTDLARRIDSIEKRGSPIG